MSVKKTNVSLNFSSDNLISVFTEIEEKTNFTFVYTKKELDKKIKFNGNYKDVPLFDVLLDISKKSNLAFRQFNKNITVKNADLMKNPKSLVEVLTDVDISGKITDENGEGLPGASIVQTGTTNGTTTDLEGNYKLSVPQESTLKISFVGYITQEISLGTQSVIDVQMEVDAAQLDEIIVVGYGTEKESNITGAISSISSDKLGNRPATNVSTALAGQIPGLTVVQKSGRPGANAGSLRIRGIGTLGNSNPLILIDGIEGDMYDVDINDIDNISVLKDASSSAIYGVRAANGVVLITTKRGSGQPVVNYHGGVGQVSSFQSPERVNAFDFARLHNEANAADGNALRYTQDDLNKWESGSSPLTHAAKF